MKSMMSGKVVEKDGRMLGSSSGGESYGLISKNDEKAPRAAANKHLRLDEAVALNDPESPERRRSQESMSWSSSGSGTSSSGSSSSTISVEDWISDDSIQQEIDERMLYEEEMPKLNIKT